MNMEDLYPLITMAATSASILAIVLYLLQSGHMSHWVSNPPHEAFRIRGVTHWASRSCMFTRLLWRSFSLRMSSQKKFLSTLTSYKLWRTGTLMENYILNIVRIGITKGMKGYKNIKIWFFFFFAIIFISWMLGGTVLKLIRYFRDILSMKLTNFCTGVSNDIKDIAIFDKISKWWTEWFYWFSD